MLTIRIIPCLDVRDGRVVKGVKFQGLRDSGSPEELAERYQEQGADEIVILDVTATTEGRGTQLQTVEKVRAKISIPLTVGGGVRSLDHARNLLNAGADKVSINTAAVDKPELLSEMAEQFGSLCTVLAIDARSFEHLLPGAKPAWEVVTKSGSVRTGIDAVGWSVRAEKLGAGEILLTSWDRDGTRSGYDTELLSAVSSAIKIPVIASGGADSAEHLKQALDAGADAVLAASIFHTGQYSVGDIKNSLKQMGVTVRI